MSKFRDGPFGPTVILFAICFVMTFALAGTYQATRPVIEQVEREKVEAACVKVLSGADSFTRLDIELPAGVTEAYRSDNGEGYVFKSQAKGFDGDVVYMIGLDADGKVVCIDMFDHNETPGLGTKVGAESYLAQYAGTSDPDAVDGITGATKTSNSLKNALRQAQEAYQLAKEAA